MNKRIWGVIIIILALLVIAGIIYYLFFNKLPIREQAAPEPGEQAIGLTLTPPAAPAVKQPEAAPIKKLEFSQDDLARMAAAFAERFGSFSNQSDYGNLRDLEIFMTADMKIWAENYVSQARAKKADASIYYGIVTKSILSQTKQFDGELGQAEILVKTQRRESAGVSANSQTFYQDLIIKYKREGSIWRVDGAYWKEK